MIRNEDFLELRESYIEIGKMVQKYGYGQYNDFIIYDADVQLRNQLNEKYNDKVKKVWNIMKDYI